MAYSNFEAKVRIDNKLARRYCGVSLDNFIENNCFSGLYHGIAKVSEKQGIWLLFFKDVNPKIVIKNSYLIDPYYRSGNEPEMFDIKINEFTIEVERQHIPSIVKVNFVDDKGRKWEIEYGYCVDGDYKK
jgi:hypothetical protein